MSCPECESLRRERDATVEIMGECVSKGRRLEADIDRLRAALQDVVDAAEDFCIENACAESEVITKAREALQGEK